MKKLFLCAAILLFSIQPAFAKHCWVWSGNSITVYVEDSELVWEDNGKEFSVTVIDIIEGQKKYLTSKFYFYERDGNWFYNIAGKSQIMPVSKNNVSGYILEFVQNYRPTDVEVNEVVKEE